MIVGLHYSGGDERARALASLSERFAGLDRGRLVVVRLPLAGGEPTSDAERVGSILQEVAAADPDGAVWVDAEAWLPVSDALWSVLNSYRAHDGEEASHGRPPPPLILCCDRDRTPPAAFARLFSRADAVIAAAVVVPRCPSWFPDLPPCHDQRSAPAPARLPDYHDLQTVDLIRTEKLVTLGQLAAGIAHELGNPLTIISSSLQYLHARLSSTDDPACDFTAAALENVERMRLLLRNMLDSTASREAVMRPLDLNDTVSELLRFTSSECRRRSLAVVVDLAPSLPLVRGNDSSIKQVFLNLIRNAFDALPERGGTLTVRSHAAPGRSAAQVVLENDGPPIVAELLPELFQPFRTTKSSGTGLGLYLSRRICRDHGGDIQVESLARGARFVVTLPADRGEGGADGEHPRR